MKLEAANLWLHGTWYDFDDNKNFIKQYYFFLIEKNSRKNIFELKKHFFENRKFSKFFIENQYKNFQKKLKKVEKNLKKNRDFFRLFWNFLYWFSMKNFEIFRFSKKYFFSSKIFFRKIFSIRKINIVLWIFLSSKSYQVPCSHKFAASNSIYKNVKTQGQKKLTIN